VDAGTDDDVDAGVCCGLGGGGGGPVVLAFLTLHSHLMMRALRSMTDVCCCPLWPSASPALERLLRLSPLPLVWDQALQMLRASPYSESSELTLSYRSCNRERESESRQC
jgi:hypothetical protein